MRNLVLVVVAMSFTACGKYSPQTEHKAEARTQHKVTSEGESTLVVKSALDLALEICEIKDSFGNLIPYSRWTANQKECISLLSFEVTP